MKEKDAPILSLSRRNFLMASSVLVFQPSAIFNQLLPADGRGVRPAKSSAGVVDPGQPQSPEWMKDLIVYEVATKGFTSPSGPESGSFKSLRGKLSYLQDLGITGIWLAGYSLCDPHHFYNIWTQYAVSDPTRFDPSLGDDAGFKSLVDDAHRHGIKIFLDVITHGLMKDSPIVMEHPSWFRGGSWGMIDFDWNGGHADLDDWWVKIYSDFVIRYGVDGFRLDVEIYRPDLWERIRRNAAMAGHPIVIWEESNSVIPGVTDFTQQANSISTSTTSKKLNEVLVYDIPGFYDRKFGRSGYYEVEIQYQDGTRSHGSTDGGGVLSVRLEGLSSDQVGRRFGEMPSKPDGLPDVKIGVDGISRKPVSNVIVKDDMGGQWRLRNGDWPRPLSFEFLDHGEDESVGSRADIHIATLSWGSSIQLSCHDNGWDGFPLDENPYVAQGSRSLFGYSFLFTPMIPIFFSGEEFDATYRPLPELSPNIYGGKNPGRGRWLYGQMLDWGEIDEPRHKSMLSDVKKMVLIRKRYSGILAMQQPGKMPKLKAVEYESNIKVPAPYVRWNDRTAIVVAANRSRSQDAVVKLKLGSMMNEIMGCDRYVVSDLWGASESKHVTGRDSDHVCRIGLDGAPGGGVAVFKIEPA